MGQIGLYAKPITIKKINNKLQGHIFLTVPGKYVLHVAAQGYKKVEKPVALNAIEPGVGRAKTTLVHLEKDSPRRNLPIYTRWLEKLNSQRQDLT